ncbi:hypothetical protein K501DRAFT_271165 [Backusella circina FSU 941]|nr:hypothetical protein K501DRAFT_271165 [Backusella circina FSU 941]
MGIIIRRGVSTTEATEVPVQAQTEAASDSSSPVVSDSPAETVAPITNPTHTETNAPTETEAAPNSDSTTPSSESTTVEQQQPTSSENKQTETEKQTDNYNTPTPTQDDTQDGNAYETPSSDNTLNSALPSQVTLAITSSTLPTSITIPFSSSTPNTVQSASTVPSCSSVADSASNSVCIYGSSNKNDSQLSGGAIAGIVVGALAALAIVCGCLLFKKRRNSRTEPPPRQSFLFTDEKPVLHSEPGSDLRSNTSFYQSENTFGVHEESQATIPKYESPAMTIISEINDPNKGLAVATALYPPIKRNKSNEYIQTNNRISVAADTDNYTQSAMKLFQPPSRAMSPASGRESQLSNNSNNQTKRTIYRPSLHQSQLMPEPSDVDHLKRESTIDPYNNKKPMSLWDDNLKSDDDINRSYNADFEWTHDNGYIQPPLYRP